jgi:hypothetical protein
VDLTGLDPTTALVTGQWATDNAGNDILINGISTAQTSGGFNTFTAFMISSNFVPGINTVDFVVEDLAISLGFARNFSQQSVDPPSNTVISEPERSLR